MRLQDKVAIVTGGGSGIGRGISLRLAADGATVVVADLDLDAADRVAAEIADLSGRATGVQVDVRKQDSVQAMVDATVDTYDGIDILVNNAGVGKIIPFFETTEADWDFMFDVNCKGVLFCSQAVAKVMIEQGRGGKIVNLASQAGRRGEALVLAYCASKACVISMTQSMALALAEHKINVNAVAPGIVDTPFWEEVDRQFATLLNMEIGEPKRTFTQSIPLGRIEQPEDVAGAVAFLASSDADYITQQCLNVDGGNWPS
ncbi:MAG: L-iditol 2-dehydrogenase [Thermomicrobiales bacterium]|nr:L-iditol 2-dehydrogenase [Thermomicrobiales bacterium]MCO5222199.1 L-iditol 2-dehydrogenase [Thermomicrobiales bacterium]